MSTPKKARTDVHGTVGQPIEAIQPSMPAPKMPDPKMPGGNIPKPPPDGTPVLPQGSGQGRPSVPEVAPAGPITVGGTGLTEVTKDRPCEVCGGANWCQRNTMPPATICMRQASRSAAFECCGGKHAPPPPDSDDVTISSSRFERLCATEVKYTKLLDYVRAKNDAAVAFRKLTEGPAEHQVRL